MHLQHYLYPRITIDDTVCFSKPCVRGLRMPVASILEYLGVTAAKRRTHPAPDSGPT